MSTDTDHPQREPSGEAAERNGESSDKGESEGESKNALEWAVVLLGAAIVLFTFGYLATKMFSGAAAPPRLTVALGTPETQGDLVLVPVEVRNEGGRVAQKATVEVCAGDAECAQLDFPFVPHQAVRTGQIGFTAPLGGPLRSRVMSYRE